MKYTAVDPSQWNHWSEKSFYNCWMFSLASGDIKYRSTNLTSSQVSEINLFFPRKHLWQWPCLNLWNPSVYDVILIFFCDFVRIWQHPFLKICPALCLDLVTSFRPNVRGPRALYIYGIVLATLGICSFKVRLKGVSKAMRNVESCTTFSLFPHI